MIPTENEAMALRRILAIFPALAWSLWILGAANGSAQEVDWNDNLKGTGFGFVDGQLKPSAETLRESSWEYKNETWQTRDGRRALIFRRKSRDAPSGNSELVKFHRNQDGVERAEVLASDGRPTSRTLCLRATNHQLWQCQTLGSVNFCDFYRYAAKSSLDARNSVKGPLRDFGVTKMPAIKPEQLHSAVVTGNDPKGVRLQFERCRVSREQMRSQVCVQLRKDLGATLEAAARYTNLRAPGNMNSSFDYYSQEDVSRLAPFVNAGLLSRNVKGTKIEEVGERGARMQRPLAQDFELEQVATEMELAIYPLEQCGSWQRPKPPRKDPGDEGGKSKAVP